MVVPKDWPPTKRLVWTLTNRGRTNLAKAWLEPEWEVDKSLITSDAANDPFTGSLGRPVAESVVEGDTAARHFRRACSNDYIARSGKIGGHGHR